MSAHPALTSAIIGPRTLEQLDGQLAGAAVVLNDELLDRIDEIVPPGVDVAPLEGAAYLATLDHTGITAPPTHRRTCGGLTRSGGPQILLETLALRLTPYDLAAQDRTYSGHATLF